MSDTSGKEREVREGDEVTINAHGVLVLGRITRVTAEYVWLEYTLPLSGLLHNTKRHRDITLLSTKYY